MNIEIIQTPLFTTVQDAGRFGVERFGMPVSGAMDELAFLSANLLAGNNPDAAVLEMGPGDLVFRPDEDMLCALTGVDGRIYLPGRTLPFWMAFRARAGEMVHVNICNGMWTYLAVAGGLDVPLWLGSRSTYLRAGLGGLEGRMIQSGDCLPVGTPKPDGQLLAGRNLPPEFRPCYTPNPTLRVIAGPQEDRFSTAGWQTFISADYSVSPDSDRMGYRLTGARIEQSNGADILSEGMVRGAVQVPAGGQPMVMMADRPVTGGYTKIATVARADLPLLAQLVPGGGPVHFVPVSVEEAREAWRFSLNRVKQMED